MPRRNMPMVRMINDFRGDILIAGRVLLIRNETLCGDDAREDVIPNNMHAFEGVYVSIGPNAPRNQQREVSNFVARGGLPPLFLGLSYRGTMPSERTSYRLCN